MSSIMVLEALTLATLLDNVGTIVSEVVEWVATLITTITAQPLLLFACILPFVGYGVHMLKMLLSTKA